MASGFSVVSRTTTSITFKITLSNEFTASNYIRVGVCNFIFENELPPSYFIENAAFNRVAWATTDYNSSTVVYLTVNGLEAGTLYTFYGFAQAKNGYYYCIPYPQEALQVTTSSGAAASGIPEGLICRKRYQEYELTYCHLDFEVTLPSNAYYANFEMSYDSDFSNVYETRRFEVSNMTLVSGYTYSFKWLNVPCATTFYIRARCQAYGGAYGSYCSAEQISTPPSREIFDSDIARFNYSSVSGNSQLFLRNEVLDYDFTRAVFTVYKDGVPIYITYTKKDDVYTSCNNTLSHTEYKDNFSTIGSTGIKIDNLEEGDYLGVIRVYFDVGKSSLQPVDEDGNVLCFMKTITVESTTQRPDYFEWDNVKTSGGEYNLTADEWISLTKNINELFEYKELSAVLFTEPVKDVTVVTDDIFNEVISAISALGYFINSVNSGEVMYAQIFKDIKESINSVE